MRNGLRVLAVTVVVLLVATACRAQVKTAVGVEGRTITLGVISPLTGAAALVVLGPAAALDLWGVLAALGGVSATGIGMIPTKRWGRPAGVR